MAGRVVERMYAWIALNPNGDEGICGMELPGMGMVPLVGANRHRMLSLRPYAERTRAATGCPVSLVVFSNRHELERLL